MATFQEVVTKLMNKPDLHAKFVNTLSLLEYIGARKIIKSQEENLVSMAVLSHAAEEIRHAQVLKKVALKMSGGVLKTYDESSLLCGPEARHYIQTIDHESKLNSQETHYLVTTLLLEERAQKIYPHYEEILSMAGFPGIMRGIVQEEDAHLGMVVSKLGESKGDSTSSSFQDELTRMRIIEDQEFSAFMQAVEKEIRKS